MKRKVSDNSGGGGKHRIIECPHCKNSMRADNLSRHIVLHNDMVPCRFCKVSVRSDLLLKHETICKDKVDEKLCNRKEVEKLDTCPSSSSVCGYFTIYNLDVEQSSDYDKILGDVCNAASTQLMDLVLCHPIKTQIIASLLFYKEKFGEREESEKTFRSICEPLLIGDNIEEFLARARTYIKARIEEYERLGSGWIFDKLQSAHLEVAKYSPLAGSGSVAIPNKIKKMKSVLNITAPDNRCFLYCILAKLFPVKTHADRYTKYLEYVDKINFGTATFPVKMSDISTIEKLNNLSIAVFGWDYDEDSAVPLKHGSGIGTQVDLLYLQDDDAAHYLLIKDFNAFMRHRTKHHNSMFYCRKCLHGFTAKSNHDIHFENCSQGINQIVAMPQPGFIEFKAIHKQEKKLFVVYFDFESLLVPYHSCDRNPRPSKSSFKKIKKSFTDVYQRHVPCSFSIVTKSEFTSYKQETVVYAHEDPAKVTDTFIKELNRIYSDMMKCYHDNQHPIDMTVEDELKFLAAKECHICKKTLDWKSKKDYPVRDHDHLIEKQNFRGAAHNSCNINYFMRTKKIPAFCHNLKGYDLNLFLIDLVKHFKKTEVIPENLEKFKAVLTESFIFLDSFAFMSTSLDKLVENLKTTKMDSFPRLQTEFPEHYKDLTQKGQYFYDYASSYSVFAEEKLPDKSKFYNQLKEEELSDKDYKHAQHVFQLTGCNNLLDYMLLYVKTDAVLLCDVFESFRTLCMSYYGLDPCHFFSLPAFTWDAMLKMTGVKLEYITNQDHYTFIEKNIRGGVTTINHRLHKANNKYLDDFNPEIPSSFINYIDCNNLYGASMMMKLPIGGFRWLTSKELSKFDVMKIDADGNYCYILEVDLKYPSCIHDAHNDYPLAVESKLILEEDISPYNRQFLVENNEKFKTSRKLCPDLKDKKNYVCSLRNLQLFISQGLLLETIHRVLVAEQSAFLRSYIEFNSEKRLNAKSNFESDFFKLCNNAIYGKTIEDLRKRSNVEIVKDTRRACKLTSKPQFKGQHILDEDVTIVQTSKTKIILNKPIACGFMVLENAKHFMGQLWYTILKPKYGTNIKLLLSDTDSFVYATYTNDAYKDLYDIRQHMDLSGYSKTSPLAAFRDPTKKKVPGFFSDERPNEIIREVVALKPKMYSILTKVLECYKTKDDVDHECNDDCFVGHSATAKGIKTSAKKRITHDDYKAVLMSRGTTMSTAKSIRSYKHSLFSIVTKKRGLSAYDDKKYITDNGIETMSYGHVKLNV